MKHNAVVFTLTLAQLETLRACATNTAANPYYRARRNPRDALRDKHALELRGQPGTYTPTAFGRALIRALIHIKPPETPAKDDPRRCGADLPPPSAHRAVARQPAAARPPNRKIRD